MADITHLEAHRLLQLATDAAIEPDDRLAIEAHTAACPECQAYRRSLEATEHILRGSMRRRWDPQKAGLSIDKIQKHTGRAIMFKQTAITAGTLAIIAGLAFAFFVITKPPMPDPVTAAQVVPGESPSPSPTVVATISVIVGADDTCASIADRFNVSVQSIIELNHRSAECILNLGETLLIPQPAPTGTPSAPPAEPLVLSGELRGYLRDARWSPDGNRIAFVFDEGIPGSSHLEIVNADGSGLRQVAEAATNLLNWLEDGSTLFFCLASPDPDVRKSELFSISADGTGLTNISNRKITQALQGSCQIVPSPDGKRLAFTTQVFDGGLYVMDLNGENLHALIPEHTGVYEFTWSPDGSEIVFMGQDSFNNSFASGLYRVRSNGGEIISGWSILPIDGYRASNAVFSPDGQEIAYVDPDPGSPYHYSIYTIQSTGSEPIRRVELPAAITQIAWSPDGTQLAFAADLPGQDIHVVNADGSNLRYYNNPGRMDLFPTWSPDGQQLVFVSSNNGEDGQLLLIGIQDLQPYPSP